MLCVQRKREICHMHVYIYPYPLTLSTLAARPAAGQRHTRYTMHDIPPHTSYIVTYSHIHTNVAYHISAYEHAHPIHGRIRRDGELGRYTVRHTRLQTQTHASSPYFTTLALSLALALALCLCPSKNPFPPLSQGRVYVCLLEVVTPHGSAAQRGPSQRRSPPLQ